MLEPASNFRPRGLTRAGLEYWKEKGVAELRNMIEEEYAKPIEALGNYLFAQLRN